MFLNVLETDLKKVLSPLRAETPARWGRLNAQQMIEHLEWVVQMSTGKHAVQQEIPEDKIERAKKFLASEHPMPKDFRANFIPADPASCRHENLEQAIDKLVEEVKAFEKYYSENPQRTHLHPSFGILNAQEWTRIHDKHFTHHFQQFGIL